MRRENRAIRKLPIRVFAPQGQVKRRDSKKSIVSLMELAIELCSIDKRRVGTRATEIAVMRKSFKRNDSTVELHEL